MGPDPTAQPKISQADAQIAVREFLTRLVQKDQDPDNDSLVTEVARLVMGARSRIKTKAGIDVAITHVKCVRVVSEYCLIWFHCSDKEPLQQEVANTLDALVLTLPKPLRENTTPTFGENVLTGVMPALQKAHRQGVPLDPHQSEVAANRAVSGALKKMVGDAKGQGVPDWSLIRSNINAFKGNSATVKSDALIQGPKDLDIHDELGLPPRYHDVFALVFDAFEVDSSVRNATFDALEKWIDSFSFRRPKKERAEIRGPWKKRTRSHPRSASVVSASSPTRRRGTSRPGRS